MACLYSVLQFFKEKEVFIGRQIITDLCSAPKPAFGIKGKYPQETTIIHDQPYHVYIYIWKKEQEVGYFKCHL